MTPNAFTVEARGWTFLGRRYVIMCEGKETYQCADKEAAEKFADSLNVAYHLGFLAGRGHAMQEAAEMVKPRGVL